MYDRRRRHRLVRIVTLGVLVPVVLLLPTTFVPTFDVVSFVALSIALLAVFGSLTLNRFNQTSAGGYVLLGGIVLAIAWDIVGKSHIQVGVDLGDLRLYDLFAIPILLSGVLLRRRAPIIIAAATITFTAVSLILLPKTPALQQYWNGTYKYTIGSFLDVVGIATLIQFLTAVVAWLGAESIRRALMDATRAEELDAANQRNAAQARELTAQRTRLQAGIQEIQQVHSAVARGRWDARARVAEGELLPVAMSLNLLLDRLSRLTREQEQRTRLEAAIRDLSLALRRTRAGEPYSPPGYSGTQLDEVLVELSTLRPNLANLALGKPVSGGPSGTIHSSGEPALSPSSTPTPSNPNPTTGDVASAEDSDRAWPSLVPEDDLGIKQENLPEWLRRTS
jgi:hypothetical protein